MARPRKNRPIFDPLKDAVRSMLTETIWLTGSNLLPFIWRRESPEQVRRNLLATLLRATPWWIKGHLRLGTKELDEILARPEKPSPRAVVRVELCGKAANLLSERVWARKSVRQRARAESLYLISMVEFLRKDYGKALEDFTFLLAWNVSRTLRKPTYWKALEYAGAAAMALNDRRAAMEYFSKIPDHALSNDTRGIIEAIRRQA